VNTTPGLQYTGLEASESSCALRRGSFRDEVQPTFGPTNIASDICSICWHMQALLAQGDANKAVPDIQRAIQLSSGDDAAVMQEALDRARAQVPVDVT
jgi:hypothetical protein